MHDNNKESLQGDKPQPKLSKRTRMLAVLANWVSEFNTVDSVENQKELLEYLKEAYLTSSYANDQEERTLMLVLFNHLEDLLNKMDRFTKEDYRAMDEWILEISQLIIKEAS